MTRCCCCCPVSVCIDKQRTSPVRPTGSNKRPRSDSDLARSLQVCLVGRARSCGCVPLACRVTSGGPVCPHSASIVPQADIDGGGSGTLSRSDVRSHGVTVSCEGLVKRQSGPSSSLPPPPPTHATLPPQVRPSLEATLLFPATKPRYCTITTAWKTPAGSPRVSRCMSPRSTMRLAQVCHWKMQRAWLSYALALRQPYGCVYERASVSFCCCGRRLSDGHGRDRHVTDQRLRNCFSVSHSDKVAGC